MLKGARASRVLECRRHTVTEQMIELILLWGCCVEGVVVVSQRHLEMFDHQELTHAKFLYLTTNVSIYQPLLAIFIKTPL